MQALMASVVVTSQLLAMGATPVKPKWNRDYGQALEAARTAKRPLVVVIENPKVPEESLDKKALLKEERSNQVLSRFELCQVDVNTKVGKLVAEAFGATRLPYTAVTDERAKKVIYRGVGQRRPSQWIAMLASRDVQRLKVKPTSRLSPLTPFASPLQDMRTSYFPENCFT